MSPSQAHSRHSSVRTVAGPPVRRQHIAELDGLRGFAIALVFGTHLWTYPATSPVLNRLFSSGWMGVDLFFVLSGFLITGILLSSRDAPRYYRNFYARRALRIFPVYYLLLVVVLLVLPVLHPTPEILAARSQGWWYVLYLANVAIASGGWMIFLLDITWSLSVEEQFYLVWPWVVKHVTERGLTIFCVASIIVLPLVRLVLLQAFGLSWRWTHMLTPLRADAFAMGALAVLVSRGRMNIARRWIVRVAVGGSLLILLLVLAGWFERSSDLVGSIGYSLTGSTFAAILLLSLQPSVALRRMLRLRPLRHLGRVSYGGYLYHPLCLVMLGTAMEAVGLDLPRLLPGARMSGVVQIVAVSLLTWGVATVSFRLFEEPILRLKSRFASAGSPLGGGVASTSAAGGGRPFGLRTGPVSWPSYRNDKAERRRGVQNEG